ncbi:MAG: GDSL-type esterase/lipase family protein [Ignavibacteria bacterium]|nr:GDSL-type esterase/lipase family protein [Ignavibacteria bacterium]
MFIKLIIIVCLVLYSTLIIHPQSDTTLYKKNPLYIQEMGLYEIYKTKQANIVMLGDSHIQGANWGELLGRNDVVNRGITSDVIEGYISRIYYVLKLKPKVCFIMGGLNDVYMWIPIQTIFQNYVSLVNTLKEKKIKVVIHSALYPAEGADNPSNRNLLVEELNSLLKGFAEKENIPYIDLTKTMSRNLFTKKELINPWFHLNADGYKLWTNEVEKVLKKLRI